jgi:hypothetical protein
MAEALGIDENLLVTLAAKEGGWSNWKNGEWTGDLNENIKDNNPFGVNETEDGKASGNMTFDSVAHAIAFWMKQPKSGSSTYAERIRQILEEKRMIRSIESHKI